LRGQSPRSNRGDTTNLSKFLVFVVGLAEN
jgi:hypothetical protein